MLKHLKEKPLVISADTRKRNILSPWEQDDHIFYFTTFFSKRTFMFISVSKGQSLSILQILQGRKLRSREGRDHEKYSIGKETRKDVNELIFKLRTLNLMLFKKY